MKPEKIGFIGAGNIAEALIRGIITSGYLDPGQIIISDTDSGRLNYVHSTLGPLVAENNSDNAAKSQIIFLTVKPTQVLSVAEEIAQSIGPNSFIISVAAGKLLGSIKSKLNGHNKTCRIMPNLAVNVRKGTIGLYAEGDIAEDDLKPILSLLGAVGSVFRIDEEILMPAVTALSGSAPAYYVMMADALIEYGISQGLNKELAVSMILETMEGSASWASNSNIPLSDLWKRVVTPGGTTEAGITYYNEKGFIDIFVEGLSRAVNKGKQIGDG
jgi:pyrroline-5-carboxylate reductase